ncbi:TrmB family transcriptional regulator [Candidatus Nomurabacteria bacterium]|nr:TrmB family transcriptional regulator [Candidatus Nomurabacteria bacterium]
MYTEILQNIGLSKNESEIYEMLLKYGESSVAQISTKTGINRRNVYDVLDRMMDKGLVFPLLQKGENRYKAVDPSKLRELIREKENMLAKVFPDLEQLYYGNPQDNEVYIYKGPEGWKNYMRDMVRIGEPGYFIGAKGAWLDERVRHFFPEFIKEAERKQMKFYHLFDYEVKEQEHDILKYVGERYKFLPKGYTAPGAIDIFGDHVNILSNIHIGGFEEDFSFTVIVNKQIADAFRIWFQFMWDFCPYES